MVYGEKRKRFCLCVALFLLFFGICLANARLQYALREMAVQKAGSMQTVYAADAFLERTSYINTMDANLNMEMQQQMDEYTGDCEDEKYWVGMPQESFAIIKKRYYMEAQIADWRNEHQREQATSCIHESDGKKRAV